MLLQKGEGGTVPQQEAGAPEAPIENEGVAAPSALRGAPEKRFLHSSTAPFLVRERGVMQPPERTWNA